MSRPPFPVVFVGPIILALGETAGALMSQLRPETLSVRTAWLRGTH